MHLNYVTSETSQRKASVEQSDTVIRLSTKVNDWGGEVLGRGQGCEQAQQTSPPINFEALSVVTVSLECSKLGFSDRHDLKL